MARETPAGDQLIAELSRLGPARVRERHAAAAWGRAGRKAKLVELWLAEQERADAAAEAERAEVARSSRDAAKRSAVAAERSVDAAEVALAIAKDANVRAALALAIAAASLIVQLMLAFVRSLPLDPTYFTNSLK
jgi:hypothetical protein